MKNYLFLIFLILMHSNVHSMLLIRALILKPHIKSSAVMQIRPHSTKTPHWHQEDRARTEFYNILRAHHNKIDTFGFKMLSTIVKEYAEKKSVTVSIHSVDSNEKRNETWKKWVTTETNLPSHRFTAYAYPNNQCYYKEQEISSIERLSEMFVYDRSLCKSRTEVERCLALISMDK